MPPVAAVNVGGQQAPSNMDKCAPQVARLVRKLLTVDYSEDGCHDGRKYVSQVTIHAATGLLTVYQLLV